MEVKLWLIDTATYFPETVTLFEDNEDASTAVLTSTLLEQEECFPL